MLFSELNRIMCQNSPASNTLDDSEISDDDEVRYQSSSRCGTAAKETPVHGQQDNLMNDLNVPKISRSAFPSSIKPSNILAGVEKVNTEMNQATFYRCKEYLSELSSTLEKWEKKKNHMNAKLKTRIQTILPKWCLDFLYSKHPILFPGLHKSLELDLADLEYESSLNHNRAYCNLININTELQQFDEKVQEKPKIQRQKRASKQHLAMQSRTRGTSKHIERCKSFLIQISDVLKQCEQNQKVVNYKKIESRFESLPTWCFNYVYSRHPYCFPSTDKNVVYQTPDDVWKLPKWFGDCVSLSVSLANIKRDLIESKGLILHETIINKEDDNNIGQLYHRAVQSETYISNKNDISNLSLNRLEEKVIQSTSLDSPTMKGHSEKNDRSYRSSGMHNKERFSTTTDTKTSRRSDEYYRSSKINDKSRIDGDTDYRQKSNDKSPRKNDTDYRSSIRDDKFTRKVDLDYRSSRGDEKKRDGMYTEGHILSKRDDKAYKSTKRDDRDYRLSGRIDSDYRSSVRNDRDYRSSGTVNKKYIPDGRVDRDYRPSGRDDRDYRPSGRGDTDYRPSGRDDRDYRPSGRDDRDYRPSGRDGRDFRPSERDAKECKSLGRHAENNKLSRIHDNDRGSSRRDYRSSGVDDTHYMSLDREDRDDRSSNRDNTYFKSFTRDFDYRAADRVDMSISRKDNGAGRLSRTDLNIESLRRDSDPDDKSLLSRRCDMDYRSMGKFDDQYLRDKDTDALRRACLNIDKSLSTIGGKTEHDILHNLVPSEGIHEFGNGHNSAHTLDARNKLGDLRNVINKQKIANLKDPDPKSSVNAMDIDEVFQKGKHILDGISSNVGIDNLTSAHFYEFLKTFEKSRRQTASESLVDRPHAVTNKRTAQCSESFGSTVSLVDNISPSVYSRERDNQKNITSVLDNTYDCDIHHKSNSTGKLDDVHVSNDRISPTAGISQVFKLISWILCCTFYYQMHVAYRSSWSGALDQWSPTPRPWIGTGPCSNWYRATQKE